MKYTCVDLKYAKLHLIKTKKFRSINIKILLKDEIKKEDITKRNFLTDYLVLTTKKYKTRKELALKTQELYSLYISAYNSRIGNYLITRFNMSLLNPKYTEDKMLNESIDLLHEIIFKPNAKNEEFDNNLFRMIKNDIKAEIETFKENPKMYANVRMLETMDKEKPFSYHSFGYLEDLEKITPKNLYTYYKDFLTKSSVDIYVIGDFLEEEMINLIKEKLNFKTLKKAKKDIYIKHEEISKKEKKIIETEKFSQSKLAIGCKLINLDDFERKYVINLYNMILGGGFNSKFMQEIREKNSLAYYINSSVSKADNILLIQSGISYENFNPVLKSIKQIIKNMPKTVTELELEQVKIEYLSILDETYENLDSIVENYIASDLLNLDDYELRKEMIKKVSLDDIKKVSKKVVLDTVYLLKGDNNGKD